VRELDRPGQVIGVNTDAWACGYTKG
jgi:hypothetical protein